MPRPPLLLLLFITGSMLMTGLVIREEELRPEDSSRSALAVLLGDGRRLFANHFLAKADAYFHRGRYPSIFEVAEEERQNFLQQSLADGPIVTSNDHHHCSICGGHHADGACGAKGDAGEHVDAHPHEHGLHSHDADGHAPGHDHEGIAHDDGDAPDVHEAHPHDHEGEETSLAADDHHHCSTCGGHHSDDAHVHAGDAHQHDEACAHAEPPSGPNDWIARLAASFEPNRHVHLEEGGEREMLPWVRLAVEMDPHNVEAYAIGGYWLRQMGKMEDAQDFLREGLRNNPGSYEIYFELGRLMEEQGNDPARTIRLYELSMQKWRLEAEQSAEPDTFALAQIVGRLGRMHEELEEYDAALHYYKLLKSVAVNPDGAQRLIDSVEQRLAEEAPDSSAL